MAEIKNSDDLRAWLKGKPKEYSVVIASRIALRVLPLIETICAFSEVDDNITDKFFTSIFRASLLSWFTRNYLFDVN